MEKFKSFFRERRYAPLLNIAAGIGAIGESVAEAYYGDWDAAKDSIRASVAHFVSGAPVIAKNINSNAMSLGVNFGVGTTYLLTDGGPSRSVSYSSLPLVNLIGVAANAGEMIVKDYKPKNR